MSHIAGWHRAEPAPIMRPVNALRRSIRDGVLRELRRLGCRTTELVNLLGIPRATVARAVERTQPDPAFLRRRQLTALEQWVITAFWHEVAGRDGLNPPPVAELLRSFCNVCRGGRAPHPGLSRRANPLQEYLVTSLTVPAAAGATELEQLYDQALRVCWQDPRPDRCLSGPARFALFCAGLGAHPWTVAVFVNQHVSSRACAVRACLRCGRKFVSPSRAHLHCGCGPDADRLYALSPTRLARAEFAFRP